MCRGRRAGSRDRRAGRRVAQLSAARPARRQETPQRHRGRRPVARDRALRPVLRPAAQLRRFPRRRRGLSPEAQAEIPGKLTSGSRMSASGTVNPNSAANEPRYTGRAVHRIEDADLLRGQGRFGDDLPVRPGTLYAAILRSPHAHAEIQSMDVAGALAVPGVDCVVTSEDARRWTRPFAVAVKTAMEQWCLAMDRVRYV